MKSVLGKVGLTLLSLAVSIVLLELGLMLIWPVTYRRPPADLHKSEWRHLLHRPSDIPGLAYELNPGKRGTFQGAKISINSFGMRDGEPVTDDREDLINIAAVGDSFTFGFGVAGTENYAHVLESQLNKSDSSSTFQVLNFGVGGYCTRDESLVVEHKVLRWKPKLIIIGYTLNDPESEPTQPLHAYFAEPEWWQYTHLSRLVAMASREFDKARLSNGDHRRFLHVRSGKRWQSVVTAFEKIGLLSQRHDFPVLVVQFPSLGSVGMRDKDWPDYAYHDLHRQVAEAAAQQGLRTLDLRSEFSSHAPLDLMVSSDNAHPNAKGHAIVAEAIKRWISANTDLLDE